MKPPYWDRATASLAARDHVLGALVAHYPGIHLTRRGDPFTVLARAIVGQQISVKAAQSIWERFVRATGGTGDPVRLDAGRVGRTRMATLRRVGLSERKAMYLRDLARHFTSGALDPREWPSLDDETLIERLVDVKGIGRWTAEMFLIFHELRPDVFPVDDIGLQKAVALHYRAGERMPVAELREFGERWAPYRSVATWYLWRSLDPIPVEY
jgi:DNA-3-methyladenine glycosylase II